ncbi:hypothetical protein ACFYOR_24855 [Streptomyces griseofuscus]|uniref:tetratricopeptide repeat protein n=1 Tax=Streptomyces griseofuscus TaxID=146922 RepID=UPI00369F9016
MARIAELIADYPDDMLPGCPSKDTVHRIIGSSEFPAQQANVVSVAAVLAREARWDVSDAVERVRSAWVSALLAEPVGKPLTELDPYGLEVHQSITVPSDKHAPLLPTYVIRDHDRHVQERVGCAASGQSVLITIVGESSTGKTRTFWEAIQQLPSKWRLWQALDSAPHSDLSADLEKIGPYTVVWLNEAQRFLLTADPAEGEQVAAALRRIMHSSDRGPVLILMTLWPKYWDQLTSEPHDGQRDLHPHARHVLNGSSLRVPVTFEPDDLESLVAAAARDARLAQAMEHAEQGQVTQYLAGVPALIQRYQTAPPPVRALIDAAMDIRRLGFGEHLPLELLEAAAYEYLTDLQFDHLPDDWLEVALAHAAQPQRGIRGPLTRIRPRRKGVSEGSMRYRLADPLDQLGREGRRKLPTPPGLWDLLVHHSTATEALSIARSAEYRGLLRTAVTLYKKSADYGSNEAALAIAEILSMTNRKEETIEWYEQAHSLGASNALRFAAETLVTGEEADWDSAKAYYMRAAFQGDIFALVDCRDHMREWEYDGDADEWFDDALTDFWDHVSIESALAWCEEFDTEHNFGKLLIGAGKRARGLDILERSVSKGNFMSMYTVCEEKRRSGGIESALAYLKGLGHATHMGSIFAPMALKNMMLKEGRGEECATILREMITAGNSSAASEFAEVMRRLDRSDEAINFLCSQSAENARVTYELADLLRQESREDQALSLLTPMAAAGDSRAQDELARLLEGTGRLDEALIWYQRSAEDGRHNATSGAVRLMLRAGRAPEALTWIRSISAPDASHDRIDSAAWVLESMGRKEEAKQLKDYGWDPEGIVSAPWSILPSACEER